MDRRKKGEDEKNKRSRRIKGCIQKCFSIYRLHLLKS